MINKIEKMCRVCRSYRPHYVKNINKGLIEVDGHCVNKTPNDKFRKTNAVCECFDEVLPETKKQENEEKAASVLKDIRRELKNLIIYLEE